MKMEVQGQAEMLLAVPQLIRMGQFQYFIAIPCMYAIVIMLPGKVLSELWITLTGKQEVDQ